MHQTIRTILLLMLSISIIACGESDYRDSIPKDSQLIMSFNPADSEVVSRLEILNSLIGIDDMQNSGLDTKSRPYIFITSVGNIGLCAKVADEEKVSSFFERLSVRPEIHIISTRNGCTFYSCRNFVVGWSSSTLLALGPLLPSAHSEAVGELSGYLDSEDSFAECRLFPYLNETDNHAISLATEATALPGPVIPFLTLGLPHGSDLSSCIISADMDIAGKTLMISSRPLSPDKKMSKQLSMTYSSLRPITSAYLPNMPADASFGLFMNIDGKTFFPVISSAETAVSLLAGINQAIDLNAIIKSLNGDFMLYTMPSSQTAIHIAGALRDKGFLQDISYWRSSLPEGYSLVPTSGSPDEYLLRSPHSDLCFGVSTEPQLQFYAGPTVSTSRQSLVASSTPLPSNIMKFIEGKKIAFVSDISSLMPGRDDATTISLPARLNLRRIVYTVK